MTTIMDENLALSGLNHTAQAFIPKSLRKVENQETLRITYDSISSILSSMENDLGTSIGHCIINENSLSVYLTDNEFIMTFTPVDIHDIYFFNIYIEYCMVFEEEWKCFSDERIQFRFSNENPLDQTIAQYIFISSQPLPIS